MSPMFPIPDNYAEYASKYLVGGMSSSFRRNPFTGRTHYLAKADGPYITDVTGKTFIDFTMGNGACALGHNRPEIKANILKALEYGFYAEHESDLSIEFAKKLCQHVPCAEKVRYTNSGSEATLLAFRLARGYTGRDKIVRIDGHFHGGHDYGLCNNLFMKADLGNTGGKLSKITNLTAGIPKAIADTLFLIRWNEVETFEKLCALHGDEIAAISMVPVDYNNGCVTTTPEYLKAIRAICDQHGILLIFDEVLSGFRTGLSCAQGYYGVTPDICTLAKMMTNGVPLAAVVGKEKVMMKIWDEKNPVVSGGTFSGNVIGCAAGMAVMGILEQPGFYDEWLGRCRKFFDALQKVWDDAGVPCRIQDHGCSFFIYPGCRDEVKMPQDFGKLNLGLAVKFVAGCEARGVNFHSDFTVSALHDQKVLDQALEVIASVVKEIKG